MKRPFAVAGVGYAIALAVFFGEGTELFLMSAAIAALIIHLISRRIGTAVPARTFIVLLAASAAAFFVCQHLNGALARAESICTREGVVLKAVVLSHTDYGGAVLYKCRVCSADGEKVDDTSLSFFSTFELEDGHVYMLSGEFSVYSSDACYGLSLNAENVRPVEDCGVDSLTVLTARLRRAASGAINSFLDGESAALCTALITGDRSGLSLETKLDFSRTGIVHILAVSGLHISILLGGLAGFLRRVGIRGAPLVAVLGLFGISACLFYGMTPSVIRACVMGLTSFSADVLVRKQDSANTMGFAALAVLIPFPRAVLGASFLLSFGCCAAIRLVFPHVERGIDAALNGGGLLARAARSAVKAMALAATVNACIFPILMLFDMELSLAAVVLSPLAVAAVGLLMPLILIMCVLSPARLLALVPAVLCRLLARALLCASELSARLPFASIPARSPWTAVCYAGCLAVILIRCFSERRVSAGLASLCCLLIIACGAVSFSSFSKDRTLVTVYRDNGILLTRGRESAAVLYTSSRNDMLYIKNYLRLHFADSPRHVIISRVNSDLGVERAEEVFEGCDALKYGEVEGALEALGFSLCVVGKHAVVFTAPDGTTLLSATRDDPELFDKVDADVLVLVERDRGYTVLSGGEKTIMRADDRSSYILENGSARRVD